MILDEVHRVPELFQPMRSVIDKGRRRDKGTGRFLCLRGGFPSGFLAETDAESLTWRRDFIDARAQPGASPQRRQPCGEPRRGCQDRGELSDLMVDLLLVRRLEPWYRNAGKRLVKSPKVYVRDSGLAHALLSIGDKEALLGHPVAGFTWEGFVIESLLAVAPEGTEPHFYRTSNGTEVDLILTLPGGALWAVEVKRNAAPKVQRGFHSACSDLAPARRFIVYPGTDRYRLDEDTEAIPLIDLARLLRAAGEGKRRLTAGG